MSLNNEHIAYIIKDITYRGIVEQDLQEELVDHICDLVETKMNNGERFIGAYNQVIKSFGQDSEIQQLQTQVIDFSNNNPKLMLKNYIKIAFRNLNRHKFYSFINVTGLAVGIACCLLITLFVLDELSYDQYHDKKDRIFRAKTEISWGELAFSGAMLPAPFAESVVNEYPEVEAAVRFRSRGSFLVARDSTSDSFKEERVIFADKDFFQMFTVPIISGDGQTALAEPNKVAISKSIADKYFPTEYALGKTLILDGRLICEVSAVYADIPENSHFHFDFLVSMISLNESENQIWLSNNFQTYLLLKEDAKADVLESKFPQLVEKYIGPQIKQFIGDDLETFYAGGNKLNYSLQPLTDIHLNSHFQVEFEPNGDIVNVYLFTAIALFILVIACINFMNLSTARSAGRAKEVGVRKVLGSYRIHLIRQFLSESVILSMLAFIIAIGLSTIMLPLFNEVSGKVLAIPFKEPVFYLVILFAALAIGILSGIYPAFFLSSFRAVNVLKGKLSLGSGSKMIRSFLVVFQFCISIILIIGTAIIFKQLNFVQNKRLGFNKEQILIVEDSYMLRNSLVPFKNDLQQSSNVKSVTVSGYLPVKGSNRSDTNFWPYGEDPQPDNSAGMQVWQTDYDYINTLGLKIIEGRGLSEEFISDSSGVVINQKALEIFGFESPIGEKIQTFAYDPGTGQFSNAFWLITTPDESEMNSSDKPLP
ncbi:MAG: ABC transporter permease, partial [Bacteroidota bacterium]